jgi:hypothetical protein
MSNLTLGLIGDSGGSRFNSTRFYYFPGGGWLRKTSSGYNGSNINVNASGPAQAAVAQLVRSTEPDEVLALGDLVYNTGASTLFDDEVGRLFNDFIAPYPPPRYLSPKGPYRSTPRHKVWPYDLYNDPWGYPNPISGNRGGSADGVNRFWPTPGNHEYYLRAGQSEMNIGLDNPASTVSNAEIIGQTSTGVPQHYLDYFDWQNRPRRARQPGLEIGSVDGSGNAGFYYKVSLGSDGSGRPLVDVFSIDAMRLTMNVGGKYPNFTNGFGSAVVSSQPDYNLDYDPSLRPNATNVALSTAANSTVPDNGWRQFRWLRRELKQSSARWQVVIGHQPVYSSGEWGSGQPDDNISFPVLQKFLSALPSGSFDAYFNGHAHYYQRVLEGNNQGIGQGIPFVTMGNSGRLLDSINETRYGDNVYEPRNWMSRLDTYMGAGIPYSTTGVRPYLLNSEPTTVGVAGGYLVEDQAGQDVGFTPGAYGFGFGGASLRASKHSMLYRYEQPSIEDPAIRDNLNADTRLSTLQGWDGLVANDWRPRDPITGQLSPKLGNTALLRLSFIPSDAGEVGSLDIENAGHGYMESRGGTHSVDFEIRGNDAITGNPFNPEDVAIARLSFVDGALTSAELLNNGSGYQFLGQVMESGGNLGATVPFTEPQEAVVPINLSLMESWYELPDQHYRDSYVITDTRAKAKLQQRQSDEPQLEVKIVGRDRQSRRRLQHLAQSDQWTTGYSGEGPQRAYRTAQVGSIRVKDGAGHLLGHGELEGGIAHISLGSWPADGELQILFGGDSSSSYLVNYRPSSSWLSL